MHRFWIMHLIAALVFTTLLGLYSLPDDQLPPRWVGPRSGARDGLTTLLAPWLAPQGAPPSEDSLELMRRMIQEQYENSITRLERERTRLQKQLEQKEKQG